MSTDVESPTALQRQSAARIAAHGRWARAVFCGLAIACAGAASAQTSFQPNWAGFGSANLGMNTLARQQALAQGRNPDAPARRPQSRVLVRTGYSRDPAVTRRVQDGFIAHVAQVAGAEKAQLVRSDLTRQDFATVWRRLTVAQGYRDDDVADALGAYWELNWAMANGQDPSTAQSAGARSQVRATVQRNPAFARLTDAQRQAAAEAWMLNYVYQQGAYADALKRGDKALQQSLSDAAAARFQNEMHIDLRATVLTPRGFSRRG